MIGKKIKKRHIVAFGVMVTGLASAALWTQDFSSITYVEVNQCVNTAFAPYDGTRWAGVEAKWLNKNKLRVYANENDAAVRSAGTVLAGSLFESALELTFTFDIKVGGNAGSKGYVSIWEADASAGSYSLKVVNSPDTFPSLIGPSVSMLHESTYEVGEDGTYTVNFTRTSAAHDVVIMLSGSKVADWSFGADFDNLKIDGDPKAATIGLITN